MSYISEAATVEDVRRIVAYHFIKLENKLDQLLLKENTLVTQAQLDAGIAALKQEFVTDLATLSTAVTTVDTDVNNLLIKVKNGQPTDLTTELQSIVDTTSQIKAGIGAVVAAAVATDQTANPPGSSDFGQVPGK